MKELFMAKKEQKIENNGSASCADPKCPIHGNLKVRGNVFVGKVVSAKARKTVTIERTLTHFVPKFERYKKVRSKIAAYNPDCIAAKEKDIVKIGECRKLSKTKSFVVLGIEKKAVEIEEKKADVK
jgi:small subunit ribosomal protein S17